MTGALSLRPALALPRLSGRHGLPRQGAAPRSQDLLLHAAKATLTLVVLTGIYSGHQGTPTPKGAAYAIVGATATERQIVEEIQDRYTTEGLELPDLRVTFTDQDEPCRGYDGYYIYGQALVTFCRPADEGWRALGKLVTHEFAHAWDDHKMTEKSRVHYMSAIGVDPSTAWLDPDLPHHQRPGERFTGTVSGLLRGLIDAERFHGLIGTL